MRPSRYRYLARRYGRIVGTILTVALLAFGLAGAGYVLAEQMVAPETYSVRQLVTVVRTEDGKVVTAVELRTRTRIRTRKGPTELVTVVRNGETITIPARTVTDTDTVRGPVRVHVVDGKTVTDTTVRTQTQTNTETQTQRETQTQTMTTDRTTTITETETRNVPGPERTVTETQHETGPTTTVTDTVTETVTAPAP